MIDGNIQIMKTEDDNFDELFIVKFHNRSLIAQSTRIVRESCPEIVYEGEMLFEICQGDK